MAKFSERFPYIEKRRLIVYIYMVTRLCLDEIIWKMVQAKNERNSKEYMPTMYIKDMHAYGQCTRGGWGYSDNFCFKFYKFQRLEWRRKQIIASNLA